MDPSSNRYDLFSRQFKADPFATFATMRQEAPIYCHRDRSGHAIWYVTRYADILDLLHDPRFIKDRSKLQPPRRIVDDSIHDAINRNMLFSDAPDHTRLRTLVNQAFTPSRIAAVEPQVQHIAQRLLNQVQAKGTLELIGDYALPLPVIVISDMLGIPADMRDTVAVWSQSIISPGGRGLKRRQRQRMMQQFVAYLQTLFAARRREPRDDLITALVQVEAAGDRLSEAELSSMVALLLVTGHETTVNLIGNGVLTLLHHPQQLALLQQQPALIDSAIEEILRYDGPVETSTTRWVAEDLNYKGHQMRRGDVLRVVLASANRDPAQFEHPDKFDIRRAPNRHLQFGHGSHYCLGAPLARLEGRVAIGQLFARFPSLQLALPDELLQWRSGVLFRGLQTLPLTW